MTPRSATLMSALLGIAPDPARAHGVVVAFTGAGGKTSALFALARELADQRVVATTTTRMRDPRAEGGRRIGRVLIDPALASVALGTYWARALRAARRRGRASSPRLSEEAWTGSSSDRSVARRGLRESADFGLVEADGARGLRLRPRPPGSPSFRAARTSSPALCGLDCLGRPSVRVSPMSRNPRAPRRLRGGGRAGGGAPAPPRGSPEGLFKGAPSRSRRAIVLNKADAAGRDGPGPGRSIGRGGRPPTSS